MTLSSNYYVSTTGGDGMRQAELENAIGWYRQHKNHVNKLIDAPLSYRPSKEDIGKPELWKPAHWRWFKANFVL